MNRYPDNVLTLTQIFQRSVRLHYLTLKHTIAVIIFMTIARYAFVILSTFFLKDWMQVVLDIVAAAVFGYLFSVALFSTQKAYLDQSINLRHSFAVISKRILPILLVLFVYFGGIVAIYYFFKWLLVALIKLVGENLATAQAGVIFLAGVFALVFVMLFYFAFPIAVINAKSLREVFFEAAILGEKEKTGVLILFVIFCLTLLLLTPGMTSKYFLSVYHLTVLFDFIVLCVVVPLYINLTLFTIHNARQKI